MKERIWHLLVLLMTLVPRAVREKICNLMLGVAVRRGSSRDLRALLNMHDQLLHCIDQVAISKEGGIHPKHRLMQYHRFFIDRVGAGERVLDVGCGIGAVAFALTTNGALVTGIDYNIDHISIAKTRYRHANLSFIHGDVTQALPEARFDIVVLSNVLEHIDKRVEILKILKDRFSPKKMLIRVPMIDRDWLVPLKKELGLRYFSDETHHTEYTWSSFVEEMDRAGLEISDHRINWGEIWAEVVPRGQ